MQIYLVPILFGFLVFYSYICTKKGTKDMKEKIDNAAYEIVCKMIDCGFVESEPEGLDWERTISKIICENLNITE